jgi:hypothetical protein
VLIRETIVALQLIRVGSSVELFKGGYEEMAI